MSIMGWKSFRENQQLGFDWREQLCDLLDNNFDISGFKDEDDRKAFRRVFDYVRRERNELATQLQSEKALLREYIQYLEHEAACWIEDMGIEYEESLDAGMEPHIDDDERGVRRIYRRIDKMRERLRALPDHDPPPIRPRRNPFATYEEVPPDEAHWEQAKELNAPGALALYPWLGLRTEEQFLAFAESEAAKFLTPDEYEAWEDKSDLGDRRREKLLFLAWLQGASKVHPAVPAINAAWERWAERKSRVDW